MTTSVLTAVLSSKGRTRQLVVAGFLAAVTSGAAPPSDEHPVVTIRPFHTGVCQIGKDHVLGGVHSPNERLPFVIYSFLVEGARGEKALIDLGPKTLGYCNQMFLQHGFFRDLGPGRSQSERFPDHLVQPQGNVFGQLRAWKIAPAEISHIVFSHLHADHHGMDDASNGGAAEDFPRAILHVSANGWNDNLKRRKDGRWNSYVDFAFGDFLEQQHQAGRVRFEDNAAIFPGMRTLYLGGHSVCSQAVLLETAAGLVIVASDDVYLYALLEQNILPQIRTSEPQYRAALDRLARLALDRSAILIAMHDPLVWETWQLSRENWLQSLKPISDRAVRSYAQKRGWTKKE